MQVEFAARGQGDEAQRDFLQEAQVLDLFQRNGFDHKGPRHHPGQEITADEWQAESLPKQANLPGCQGDKHEDSQRSHDNHRRTTSWSLSTVYPVFDKIAYCNFYHIHLQN